MKASSRAEGVWGWVGRQNFQVRSRLGPPGLLLKCQVSSEIVHWLYLLEANKDNSNSLYCATTGKGVSHAWYCSCFQISVALAGALLGQANTISWTDCLFPLHVLDNFVDHQAAIAYWFISRPSILLQWSTYLFSCLSKTAFITTSWQYNLRSVIVITPAVFFLLIIALDICCVDFGGSPWVLRLLLLVMWRKDDTVI